MNFFQLLSRQYYFVFLVVVIDNKLVLLKHYYYSKVQNFVTTFTFSALKQIKTYLNQGHHKKALAVLKAAMVTWPEESMFLVPEREQSTMVNNQQRYACV